MAWRYFLAELDSAVEQGRQIGEITFSRDDARAFSSRLFGNQTGGFTLRIDNPIAKEITDRRGDCLLKIYQGTTLRYIAECVSIEEKGPGYTRTITREDLCNVAYSPVGDSGIQVAANPASVAARGMYEAVVPSDTGDVGATQALLERAVELRASAKETVTLTADTGGDATVTCNFAGPRWRLGKRLCAKVPSSGLNTLPDPAIVAFSDVDRGVIIKTLIDNANILRDTGVRCPTPPELYPATVSWTLKPIAEALDELVGAPAFYLEPLNGGTSLIYDDFVNVPGTGLAYSGHSATGTVGGTWAGVNSTNGQPGWYGGGAAFGHVYRSAYGDPGAANGDLDASGAFDWVVNAISGSLIAETYVGPLPTFEGRVALVVRLQGDNSGATRPTHWVMLSIDTYNPPRLMLRKCINGTVSVMRYATFPGVEGADPYQIRLGIDGSGNWQAWTWKVGTTPLAPLFTGTDSDLSSSGPLAVGCIGLYDAARIAGTPSADPTRFYEYIYAAHLTQSLDAQPVEFAITPTEPTVDGTGVQIASMAVSSRVGADKPGVIFQAGGGNPPSNNPALFTDYIEGDVVAARAIANGQVRFDENDGYVRVYGVDGNIDKDGKETIVPQLSPE